MRKPLLIEFPGAERFKHIDSPFTPFAIRDPRLRSLKGLCNLLLGHHGTNLRVSELLFQPSVPMGVKAFCASSGPELNRWLRSCVRGIVSPLSVKLMGN